MIICHCRGISDRVIRKAIQNGARSRREVARTLGAGATCGGCSPAIEAILLRESERTERRAFSVLTEPTSTT